jgi:hypothetical protein
MQVYPKHDLRGTIVNISFSNLFSEHVDLVYCFHSLFNPCDIKDIDCFSSKNVGIFIESDEVKTPKRKN